MYKNFSDSGFRDDVYQIYQIVQEPGTLNFVKSRIAIDKNMKQLENRTILQKYGIDEMTIFLHFNEVYKENKFLMELSLFNYFNLIDPTLPMVN